VNILKDAPRDAAEGRVYIPDGVELHAVLELAGQALIRAEEYVDLLRRAGSAAGLVTFNAFVAGLARSNLRILAERGLGAKLSRSEVASVAAEVSRDLAPPPSAALGLSNAD
jgi:farnesyl-diphosphate farnesyltransferase